MQKRELSKINYKIHTDAYNVPELDICSENVITRCRKFIQENAHHLRDIDEPDEYEPPKFNFE